MAAELSEREKEMMLQTPLFQGAVSSFLERAVMDGRCRRLRAARGGVIYSPSQYERSLGVVLAGRVEVRRNTGGGRGYLTSVLGPGALFGAGALFGGEEDYVATLVAAEPCDIVLFPQSLVSDLIRESPLFAENYIRYLSGRIRFLSGKLDALAADGAERKLARFLFAMDGTEVALPCTMSALPQRLGVSRASLYRAFDALENSGAVKRSGRRVLVLDRTLLQAKFF